jgi:hypothetical protein
MADRALDGRSHPIVAGRLVALSPSLEAACDQAMPFALSRCAGESLAVAVALTLDLETSPAILSWRPCAGARARKTIAEWDGRVRRYELGESVTGRELRVLLNQLLPLFDQVVLGAQVLSSGYSTIAKLSAESATAEHAIEVVLHRTRAPSTSAVPKCSPKDCDRESA